MTLHLVAFPHTRLDGGYDTCAYTQKVSKLRRMDLGHTLSTYGCQGADVEIAEATRPDSQALPSWPDDHEWEPFNNAAARAVKERAEPGDLLLLAGGYSQREIAAALPALTACEPGVGYEGITTNFCAFESHAWRHHVYGLKGIRDGRWFDTVIPNYFDPDDFPQGPGDGGYLLFVGRLIERKGIRAAVEIAQAAGVPLVVAGPGELAEFDPGGYATHVGVIGPRERAELMGDAVALIAPTLYVEPFGGVAVEAQLCGTPAITSDWGAFTETVDDRWRFTTLGEAVAAIGRAADADRDAIRAHATSQYSLDEVAPRYAKWFDRLLSLRGDGWYTKSERGASRLSPAVPASTIGAR